MVALVSGGARGIGRGIVRSLAAAGARVVFGDRDLIGATETVGLCEGETGCVLFCEADFAETNAWPRILETCLGAGWTPTLGVSNVWFTERGSVENITIEAYAKAEAVNQRSGFLMAQTLSPVIGQLGGSLVFIGSVMSDFGTANYSLYGMTKSALTGLTRSLAVELAPRRITVNCIQPGNITLDPPREFREIVPPEFWTEFFNEFQERIEAVYAKFQILPIAGRPEDIVQAILFLASDAGRFVTGSVLRVDGGLSLSMYNPVIDFPESLQDAARSWVSKRTNSTGNKFQNR